MSVKDESAGLRAARRERELSQLAARRLAKALWNSQTCRLAHALRIGTIRAPVPAAQRLSRRCQSHPRRPSAFSSQSRKEHDTVFEKAFVCHIQNPRFFSDFLYVTYKIPNRLAKNDGSAGLRPGTKG